MNFYHLPNTINWFDYRILDSSGFTDLSTPFSLSNENFYSWTNHCSIGSTFFLQLFISIVHLTLQHHTSTPVFSTAAAEAVAFASDVHLSPGLPEAVVRFASSLINYSKHLSSWCLPYNFHEFPFILKSLSVALPLKLFYGCSRSTLKVSFVFFKLSVFCARSHISAIF